MKTTKLERDAERGRYFAGTFGHAIYNAVCDDLDEAERDFAACAHAIGVEYEADGHASQPGPVEAVIAHIEEAAAASLELIDVKAQLSTALADLAKERERAKVLEDDRRRALKRADELTLDTQTCEEAVTALVSTTRVARADAERLRAELAECRAGCDENAAEVMRLQGELAECRAELVATQSESARVVDVQRTRAEAAEARAEQLGAEVLAVRQWVADSIITDGEWSPETSDAPARRFLAFANALTPPPAGEGDEGQKTSAGVDAPAVEATAHHAPGRDAEEPGSPSGDDEERDPVNGQLVSARVSSPPTPPATSTPDDDERAAVDYLDRARARAWYRKPEDFGADVASLAALIRTRDAQAREAGRVEGWNEAVEACAKYVENTRQRLVVAAREAWERDRENSDRLCDRAIGFEGLDDDLRAIKRPDRAKGG